jgi:hypothetical protein
MKKVLIAVMAFSIVLSGCKKEADQIVSKPLEAVKGSVVAASSTPTPRPSPTVVRTATPRPSASASPIPSDKEVLKGAVEEIYNPIWLRVVSGLIALAMATLLGVAIFYVGMGNDGVGDLDSDILSDDSIGDEVVEVVAAVAAGH